MTTYQDPQPQSRRAVRQSERGDTPEQQAAPQFYADPNALHEMWDTTARRAAQLPPSAPRPDAAAAPSGRRAAQAATPAPTAEPLTYSTQGAPVAPPAPPATPLFRPRGSSAAPVDRLAPEQVPTQAMPVQSDAAYRVRDFSPEGRRAAAPVQPAPIEPASPPSDLDYHTEARLHYEVPVAPISEIPAYIAPAPVPMPEPVQPTPIDLLPPSAPGVPTEQTLSRRELRALQHAEELQHSDPQPIAPLVEPTRAVQAPGPAAAFPAAPFPPAPEPDVNTALTNAITEFDQLFQSQPAPVEQPPAPAAEAHAAPPTPQGIDEPSPWTPPTGHWSVQADLDDDEFHETTVNRTVGSASATTSALVLPTVPGGNDIRGPLTGTGEIMLTGSIELPHTFSSTGATARFDHGGIDALFDAGDAEVISTDSAPVRAIKAVSTHNSGQGVTHTQKPKGTRALTALLIAASSMAVVVAGLLITAFALNVF